MISKNTLKDFQFETIENYFDYIIDSKIVGQPQQVKNLILDLSKNQKKEFLIWIDHEIELSVLSSFLNDKKYCRQILIENL
jgi:hypothetical protein